MSKKKNKRKNSTSSVKMKNNTNKQIPWIPIALGCGIVAMTAAIIVTCAIKFWGDKAEPPVDEEPLADVLSKEEYLEQKYGQDFTYVGPASGGVDTYSSDNYNELISVIDTETLLSYYNADPKHFTEAYADNGYAIVNAEKIIEYYKKLMPVDLGTYRIMPYFDPVAFPSSITLDTAYEQCIKNYDNYFAPHLFILTDQALTNEQCTTIQNTLQATGHPIYLRIAQYAAADQEIMDVASLAFGWGRNPNVLCSENLNIPEEETFEDEQEPEPSVTTNSPVTTESPSITDDKSPLTTEEPNVEDVPASETKTPNDKSPATTTN